MTDRSGIEIDYCPNCRGVWLDRGELDKIIERSSTPVRNIPNRDSYTEKRHYSSEEDYRYKKKKSILGELFDF
jgi:Zn-finger nucleic acid-binding protein